MREFTSDLTPEEQEAEADLTLPLIRFTLDGVEFHCIERMDGDALMEWSELGRAATEDISVRSPEGAAYVARFLRASFGPEEYRRWRQHVRDHQTPITTILAVVQGIQEEMSGAVEAATDRPTVPSSPSSPGDEDPAGRLHRVISLQAGDVQVMPMPEPQDHKAKGGKPRGKRAASGGGG
jgi:hypothetical protein